MNNIIYGKTCENLTKRTDIKLVKECDKFISKPHCLRFQLFADYLAAIEPQNVKCMINKPINIRSFRRTPTLKAMDICISFTMVTSNNDIETQMCFSVILIRK